MESSAHAFSVRIKEEPDFDDTTNHISHKTPSMTHVRPLPPVQLSTSMDDGSYSYTIRPYGRKYNLYTPEMRTRIAKYAISAGDLKAAQHFSQELGHKVAMTSVWRFRKSYMRELKRLHQDGGHTVPNQSHDRRRIRRSVRNKTLLDSPVYPTAQDEQMDAGADSDWTPPTEAEMKVIQAKKERSDKISKLMGDYLLKGYRMLATSCSVCGTILLRDKRMKDYCVACNELDTEHAKDDPALSAAAARSQVREHEHVNSSPLTGSFSNQPLTISPAHSSPLDEIPTISNVVSVSDSPQQQGSGFVAAADRGTVTPTQPLPSQTPLSSMSAANISNPQATVLPQTNTGLLNFVPYQQTTPRVSQHVPIESRTTVGRNSTGDRVTQVTRESLESVMDKMSWASEELKKNDSLETSISLCKLIHACADAAEKLKTLAES